jgi:hypothetical protein
MCDDYSSSDRELWPIRRSNTPLTFLISRLQKTVIAAAAPNTIGIITCRKNPPAFGSRYACALEVKEKINNVIIISNLEKLIILISSCEAYI